MAGHHCYDYSPSALTACETGVCMKLLFNVLHFLSSLFLQSLCFHVLLIIRFSAGLYWITPEAHHWLNDVGSDTHKFDKVPSFANRRRNVMNLIEIIKGTAP